MLAQPCLLLCFLKRTKRQFSPMMAVLIRFALFSIFLCVMLFGKEGTEIMEQWTWKQRLPIGLAMVILGIVPIFFWTGLTTPVLLRGIACFCLLFGLAGGALYTLHGAGMLGVVAGYCLSVVLILLPRAPEITEMTAVLCLAGGIALLLWMNHYLKKQQKEKRKYRKSSAQPRKRYTSAKGSPKALLSSKAAAVQRYMGYLQCGVFFSGILCFLLSVLKVRREALLLALITMVLAAAWGVMQLMILPELLTLPSKKRYCAHPLRLDPALQLILGIAITALVLMNAAGQIIFRWEMLLIPGAFALAAGICAFVRSRKIMKLRIGTACMTVFFTLIVGGLGMMAANYVLPARHTDYVAQITGKYKTGGKSTSYRLKCDSPAGEIRMEVSRKRYDQQQVGDQIQIREYEGALFMSWRSLIVNQEK